MHDCGEFILLQNGKAVLYTTTFSSVRNRLIELFKQDPAAEYLITQVVGTVDKPAKPVIHSIYVNYEDK